MQRITSVEKAIVVRHPGNSKFFAIVALGTVPTTGWGSPELAARFYIMPPADGIQDFDFNAEPPKGLVITLPMPIAAVLFASRDIENYWGEGRPLLGVRIHSNSGSMEAMFEKSSSAQFLLASGVAGEDNPVPWPWSLSSAESELPPPIDTSQIIGKVLRVYRTGDPLTEDYRSDRANIELRRSDKRIESVWIG